MIQLDALKVLAAETRYTFSLKYFPSKEMRRTFFLPPTLFLTVEVFPIDDLLPFSKEEPLFYIDGYLTLNNGHPIVVPCSSNTFCEDTLIPEGHAPGTLSERGVQEAVEISLNALVSTAMRKASTSSFDVSSAACPRLCVFLLKMGRVNSVIDSIREAYTVSVSSKSILPYLIYEIYCSLLLSEESSSAVERIVAFSSALDGSLSSVEEDRAITCILTGMKYPFVRRSSEILKLYSSTVVSTCKRSLFFYLFSDLLGGESGGSKCALLSLAERSIECNTCSDKQKRGMQQTLKSMSALSSSLHIERSPCDHLIDQYIHKASKLPLISISISSEIQEGVEIKETEEVNIFTEGKISVSSSHGSISLSLLVECSSSPLLLLKEKTVTFEKKILL